MSHQTPRARTAVARQAAGEIEGHPVELLNTGVRTAAARAGGCCGMTTGQLASPSQRGTVTGANLSRTTAPALAGKGGDAYSQVVQRNHVTVGRGHGGRTAGQLLVPASQSGRPIAANLNITFADVAANNSAANQD